MPLWEMGEMQSGTLANAATGFTFGKRTAGNKVTPCTAKGEVPDFVFFTGHGEPTKAAGEGVALMHPHWGGTAIPVLAGGAIAENGEFGIDIVSGLPKAVAAASLVAGNFIVGKLVNGSSSAAEDTDVEAPSLAVLLYTVPVEVVP